jgi:hypothetical protein
LALKAALCRFRFAFISLLFLIYSKPAKVELYPWSKNRGPPLFIRLKKGETNDVAMVFGVHPRHFPNRPVANRDGFQYIPDEGGDNEHLPKEFFGLYRLEVSENRE